MEKNEHTIAEEALHQSGDDPATAAAKESVADDIAAAMTGATAGSVIGPLGVVTGAVIGAVTSIANTNAAHHAVKDEDDNQTVSEGKKETIW